MFLSLKARLVEEASSSKGDEVGDWSRTLNRWCGETSFVQYGGNPPPTLGPSMTIEEYVKIPGVDDIMTKVLREGGVIRTHDGPKKPYCICPNFYTRY